MIEMVDASGYISRFLEMQIKDSLCLKRVHFDIALVRLLTVTSANASSNPKLATAGSGDVLTGLIAALLAQGWPAEAALPAAVHLHGAAADRLAATGIGPIGLTAGELIDSARCCLNQSITNQTSHHVPETF